MKWKCTNCENEFESAKGEAINDFEEHAINCFNIYDFFKGVHK